MSDSGRLHEMTGLTIAELERARRELQASLGPARPESPVRVPIMTRLRAVEAELAVRGDRDRADEVAS
jgi:hypothetical protein